MAPTGPCSNKTLRAFCRHCKAGLMLVLCSKCLTASEDTLGLKGCSKPEKTDQENQKQHFHGYRRVLRFQNPARIPWSAYQVAQLLWILFPTNTPVAGWQGPKKKFLKYSLEKFTGFFCLLIRKLMPPLA
jgi:hypothetical protein